MREPSTHPQSAAARTQPRIPVWAIATLLALATVALFWPATRCGFVNFDDPEYVTENPYVQGGLSWTAVKWAFSNTEQASYWAPLMWLSHMVACGLFGLKPWGHHLINILLHAASTALVFLVFFRLTGARWRSLMLAALFGMHPLRVESVAWVTERKDTLSTLFWMLTLWAYVRYAQLKIKNEKGKIYYGLALVFFACGLMSKAMLVTLPFVLLLLDWWPLGRSARGEVRSGKADGTPLSTINYQRSTLRPLLLEKLPFFALAAAGSVITFTVQQHGGAVVPLDELSLGARGANALISYCRYLGKLFWPANLAVFYPYPGHWPMDEVLLAGGLLLALSALFYAQRRRQPFLLVGWLWFLGTLVPVIGFTQSGKQAMADRFTYVPSLGVLIMVIWGIYELVGHHRYQRVVLSLAGSAVIVTCAVLTMRQLGYWRNSGALFQHALEVTQNNYVAHNNLGKYLYFAGRMDEAAGHYRQALEIKPDYSTARDNLGAALNQLGHPDEAIECYNQVLEKYPDDIDALNNLGTALAEKGQNAAAAEKYEAVLRLAPRQNTTRVNLGMILLDLGRADEAAAQFKEALRLDPNDDRAASGLSEALTRSPAR